MTNPAASLRRPALLLVAAVLLLAVTTTVGLVLGVWHGYLDLRVYRLGAQAWLDGDPVYGPLPALYNGTVHLPFTYPPLAAIVFAPLAALPMTPASIIMFALTLASIAVTVWLVLARLRPTMDRVTRVAIVLAVVAFAEYLEPVRETLSFGQVNAIIMALVAIDVLNRWPRWPRGILIGILITIKLTPAGFLLLFVLRRDWRAVVTTLVSAAVAIGIAWLATPDDSREYWFHKVSQTSRIGSTHYAGNQSLKALVSRLGLADSATTIIWLVLAVVTIALAAVWMHRLLGEDRLATALTVNAAVILLISPISWSHHWVWVAPALVIAICAAVDARRADAARFGWIVAATIVAAALFYTGPHWLLPLKNDWELRWTGFQQVVGSSYVWLTFAVIAVGAWCSRGHARILIRRP